MSPRKLRVGIAGLGLIARTHATAYRQLGDVVELAAVCDVSDSVASAFAEDFGGRPVTDLDALLADPGIDVVDVILPHFLHYDVAMKALEAGKHLILEKPVAPTYQEAVAIYRKAAEAGVHFMVAENTRYMAAYQAAERLLAEGTIGDVIHVQTELRSNEKRHLAEPGDWRTRFDLGGGLVLDTGAHSFYLISWLLGEFESLRGVGKQLFPLPNEIEDTAEVNGNLKSGAFFTCTFSSVSEVPHSERLELYGTAGGILIDQMSDPVVKLFRGHDDFAGRAITGVPFGPDAWHPGGWHFESVLTEVKDYITSLVELREPLIDSRDTVYAVRVIEAAYQSIRSGEEVSLADVERAQISGVDQVQLCRGSRSPASVWETRGRDVVEPWRPSSAPRAGPRVKSPAAPGSLRPSSRRGPRESRSRTAQRTGPRAGYRGSRPEPARTEAADQQRQRDQPARFRTLLEMGTRSNDPSGRQRRGRTAATRGTSVSVSRCLAFSAHRGNRRHLHVTVI